MNDIKHELGQFFTTNNDYILQGLSKYIYNKDVCDPFAGAGDLLSFAKNNKAKSFIGYDCDMRFVNNKIVFFNNSLINPKKYDFVLTNPPYLYQNKISDNSILKNSKHTDLYQLSLEKIMDSKEGIVIVPINFLSAENSKYIRNMFFDKFEIVEINYFKKQVFSDTTYNVMAFYYKLKVDNIGKMSIKFNIFPENKNFTIVIYKKYNWQIGGEFLSQIDSFKNRLGIKRLEENNLKSGDIRIKTAYNHLNIIKNYNVDNDIFKKIKKNIILLKAIDTGGINGKICLEDIRKYDLDALVSVKTSRNQIYLLFPDYITIKEQEMLISLFNSELNVQREKYCSLFMTNYRDNDRKRISFNFAYNFLNYLYFNKIKKENEIQLRFF